ncbi:MAG: hypothetical protein NVSMB31_20760 [Vulcanimicrobiaceae bacterium]
MVTLNSRLHAYTARIHVDIILRTFPYISPSLDGRYYHKEPSKDALIFATVPAIAKQFNKIYPRIESAARWNEVYSVSFGGTQDGTASFKLVPRVHGRVDHVDAKVDVSRGTISQMTWYYNDGGYAVLNEEYQQIRGNYVPARQTGHVDVPHYKADVASTFSNFKLNAKIPDSVFRQ